MDRSDGGGIDDDTTEVDLPGPTEFVQQESVQLLPDAGPAPLVESIPEGHAAAAHFLGKVFPRNAGLEHEQDAGQTDPIRHAWLADSRNVWVLGEKRLDQDTQILGHHTIAHW